MSSVIAQLSPEGNFASYVYFQNETDFFLHFTKLHIGKNLRAISCELSL